MPSIWSDWTYYELKNSQNVLESLNSFVITCLSVVPQLVNPAVALLVLRLTFEDDATIQLQAEVRFSVVIEGRGDRVRPLGSSQSVIVYAQLEQYDILRVEPCAEV